MRSLVQLNITMGNLQAYNVKLICADIGEIDCSTPMGKVQMQIIGAITEWEREIIVQRTKEGLDARKARGAKLGRKKRDDLPLGFYRHAPYVWLFVECHLSRSQDSKGNLGSQKIRGGRVDFKAVQKGGAQMTQVQNGGVAETP